MVVSGVWGKGLSEIKNECKAINASGEKTKKIEMRTREGESEKVNDNVERERRKKNEECTTKFYHSKWNEAKKRKWLMAGFKFLPSFPDLFVEIWFFLLPFALASVSASFVGRLVCSFVIIFENLIMFKLHKIWSAYFFPFVYCWLSSILLLLLWLMKMSMNCSGESGKVNENARESDCVVRRR